MAQNKMNGLMFKMDNDPRIIPIGRFMRATSLDEFPQFINVLKGNMSLVGTRPPTEDEYIQYKDYHKRRLAVKPGITGMWQVSGRSNITDFEEVVALDSKYIEDWNIGKDIKILFKTIAVVFNRNMDKTSPVITAESDQIQVSVADGDAALVEGLQASDNKDGNLTDQIIIGKRSKFVHKGISEVTFLVFDSSNNVGSYTRTVEYKDYRSPEFALSMPLVYGVGDAVTVLDRLTVTDVIEGDISDKIKIVSSDVNKSEPGTYTIGVEACNSFGDIISAKLPINIVSDNKNVPVINLDTCLVTLNKGETFNPVVYLKDVTLTDGSTVGIEDVQINAQVDSSVVGTYQTMYSYTDAAGVTGYTSLTVVIRE